jgi:putative aldouronate transport system permease protein
VLLLATPLTLAVMLLAAYPLSKRYFPNRTFWTGILIFTMFFEGGLIPTYLIVRGVGLINNVGALLFPKLIDTFSLIIVRNYYMSIPPTMEESARIDGAGDLRILIAIILPVSLPIIATVALWTIVNHWSWWFDSMIYMTDAKKHVLQVVLRRIVLEGTSQMMDLGGLAEVDIVNPDTVKAATIMVTTIPIVCVYPFMQKLFIKGIMVDH